MKAVVLKVQDGYAAVLAEDGQFIKIKDRDYRVGMELTLEELPKKSGKKVSRMRRVRTLLVSAAALFLLAVGVKDFYTPYTTVSIDVNPSIVMRANRYDLVLDIEAVNNDATDLVSRLLAGSMRYRSIETVTEAAFSEISEGGYEAENGTTYVMMSANSQNAGYSEKIAEQLETIGEAYPDISTKVIAADDELLNRANDAGTTAGKLYLVDRLGEEEDPAEFNESDWLQRPIKDIVQEIDRLEAPKESQADAAPAQGDDPAAGNARLGDAQENVISGTSDEAVPSLAEDPGNTAGDMRDMAEDSPAEPGGNTNGAAPAPDGEDNTPQENEPDSGQQGSDGGDPGNTAGDMRDMAEDSPAEPGGNTNGAAPASDGEVNTPQENRPDSGQSGQQGPDGSNPGGNSAAASADMGQGGGSQPR